MYTDTHTLFSWFLYVYQYKLSIFDKKMFLIHLFIFFFLFETMIVKSMDK